jgi:hypothetical protein
MANMTVDFLFQNPHGSSIEYQVWCLHVEQKVLNKFDVWQAKGSQDIEWSVYYYVQLDP